MSGLILHSPEIAAPLIEARDLTVRLRGADEPILKDVDFTIMPAEIVTVVGPNGSGKSNISDAVRWVFRRRSAETK